MQNDELSELKLEDLDPTAFVAEKSSELADVVGDGFAINALSGGVDSSAVTMLAHRALGPRLKTCFVDNGLMREGEPDWVVALFREQGVPVELIDARDAFFGALKGKSDPEEKRQAVTDAFYRDVFGRQVRESGAKHLLQGTIYTDVEETVAGIKRQHNILAQLGIDTEAAYGYTLLEPLIRLRKPAVRVVAHELGLPDELINRPPFPGPALATRIVGEVTPERVETVRKATGIVEEELAGTGAFQYLAVLHEDRVTGIRDGVRDYGLQVEVRCWESTDASTASPMKLPFETLEKLSARITDEVRGVVSVTYNITNKPPSTIEAI